MAGQINSEKVTQTYPSQNPINIKEDQDYWYQVKRSSTLEAIRKCEDAAKQIITITTLLSTIFFWILSSSDLIKSNAYPWYIRMVLLTPLALWFIGLVVATRVIIPGSVDPQNTIEATYIKVSEKKFNQLRISYILLVVSMVVIFFFAVFTITQPPISLIQPTPGLLPTLTPTP